MSAEERKKEAAWFDVGIIKGTSCTVSSYYLPNGDLEKTEIDVEVKRIESYMGILKNVSEAFFFISKVLKSAESFLVR
jgi:hypothetical protein